VDCQRKGEVGKDMAKCKKCLMHYHDQAPFSWQGMQDSYKRQKDKVTHEQAGNMALSYQVVHLDSLMLMNVPLAKAAFCKEVLAEILDYCCMQLTDELKKNDLDPERDKEKGYKVKGGQGSGKWFLHYAAMFRKAIPTDAQSHKKYKQVKSDICLLEYLSVMHSIFIEPLVNKDWCLTLTNIDEELAAIREAVALLGTWQEEKSLFQAALPPGANKTSWQHHLMAWKMYCNLRIGVSGFFG